MSETASKTQNLTLVEAVTDALHTEMASDDSVVVLGEDIGRSGGVFRATQGLQEEFGEDRVVDTPLAEAGIVGTSIGLAMNGIRPVPEIQFSGFLPLAFDQIVSHAARMRTKTRGRFTVPMTIRAPYGAGVKSPEYHQESKEAFYIHEPGLKVVTPSTPYNTKGLLLSAIRDPDPVLFLEPKLIYRTFQEAVPEDEYEVPLGEAAVRREGTDVSVFSWGAMTRPALLAAEELAEEDGIDCEVVDLRTLKPFDKEAIIESVKNTGRAAVVHEAHKTQGFGAEIVSRIQEEALFHLEEPVKRITGFDTPVPLKGMEDYFVLEPARIKHEIRKMA